MTEKEIVDKLSMTNTTLSNQIPNQEEDSDDSDCDIKITLKPRKPWSSLTPEEIDEIEKKYGECDYCYSLRLPEHMYKGHYWDSCPRLKKMRCDHCAVYGHTGGHCPTSSKKLEIKCTFCFRGGKPDSKYNSHTIENCIDKKIYDGDNYGCQRVGTSSYSSGHQGVYKQSYDNHTKTSYFQKERVQPSTTSNKYIKVPDKKSNDKPYLTQDFPPLSKK